MKPVGRATVVDNVNLERDLSTNAVINKNRAEYLRRLAAKKANASKNAEFENLKSEVTQLKALVSSLLSSSIPSK